MWLPVLLSSAAFGQLCGGSFNEINFFVLNNSEARVIEYEVLPYDESHLDKMLLKSHLDHAVKASMRGSLHNGIYLSELFFDPKMMNDIKPFKVFADAVGDVADALNEQNERNG